MSLGKTAMAKIAANKAREMEKDAARKLSLARLSMNNADGYYHLAASKTFAVLSQQAYREAIRT